jgi:hypothetical protein
MESHLKCLPKDKPINTMWYCHTMDVTIKVTPKSMNEFQKQYGGS